MITTADRRIGVFIDVQNMYYSARHLYNQKVNFTNIVHQTVGDGKLVRAIAYTVSTKSGEETAFFTALRSAGIEVKSKELIEFSSGAKKGDWDVGIAIDVIRMLDMLDVVVLVSGDGDFRPLADYVRSRGRIFHVGSFRESTSSQLVEATDIYTNFSDDQETFLIQDRKRTRSAKAKSTSKKATKTKSKASAVKTIDVPDDDSFTIDDIEESRTRRLSF